MSSTTLPNRFPELVSTAVTALKLCAIDERYEIAMSSWHVPTKKPRRGLLRFLLSARSVCAVCLGGAVMAKVLDAEPNSPYLPQVFGSVTRRKLYALDDIRKGVIRLSSIYTGRETVVCYNEGLERSGGDHYITPYDEDPEQFCLDVTAFAKQLDDGGYTAAHLF